MPYVFQILLLQNLVNKILVMCLNNLYLKFQKSLRPLHCFRLDFKISSKINWVFGWSSGQVILIFTQIQCSWKLPWPPRSFCYCWLSANAAATLWPRGRNLSAWLSDVSTVGNESDWKWPRGFGMAFENNRRAPMIESAGRRPDKWHQVYPPWRAELACVVLPIKIISDGHTQLPGSTMFCRGRAFICLFISVTASSRYQIRKLYFRQEGNEDLGAVAHDAEIILSKFKMKIHCAIARVFQVSDRYWMQSARLR